MKKALTHSLVFSLCLQAFGVSAPQAHAEPVPVPCAQSLLAAAHSPSEGLFGKDLHAVVAARRVAALEAIVHLVDKLEKGERAPSQPGVVEHSVEEILTPAQRGFLLERLHASFGYKESDPRSSALLFEGGKEIDALVHGLVCRAQTEDETASVGPGCASGLGKLLMGGGTLGAFIAAKSVQYSSMFDIRPKGLLGELLGMAQPKPDYSAEHEMLFWAGLAFGAGALIWALAWGAYPQPDEAWPRFAEAVSKKLRKGVEASEDPRFYSVTSGEREMDLIFWVQRDARGTRVPKVLLLAR